jgi:endonuclease/exonuclease/phosphatase family metal-dependent hydrolase
VRIRVASYNVHGYRGGLDAVAAVLLRAHPDLVCLQECGSRRSMRRLASKLGMEAVSSHRPFGRMQNAVLFGVPWEPDDRLVETFTQGSGARPRGFVAVTLRAHAVRVLVASVHMSLTAKERALHAEELTRALDAHDLPVVLGGDLNEEPGRPAYRAIAAGSSDAYAQIGTLPGDTFPARAPTARIDYVFVRGALRPTGAWVPNGREPKTASDHLPVVVDLELT